MLAWPRDLPLGGEPADVVSVLEENQQWLASSDVPKLILTAEPGILFTKAVAEWAKETFRNLEVKHLGPGIHYVQEDHPEATGDAVKEWRRRKVVK
jgi:haloalkane dehalogenase